jgi:hypothetical protein
MKVLSPRAHGVMDYLSAAIFYLAPTLFGFGGTPAVASRVLAVGYLAFSLLTAYPLGLARVIPFRMHVAFDGVLALVLLAAPWLLGFSDVDAARNFFVAMGVVSIVVVTLTDARQADAEHALPG